MERFMNQKVNSSNLMKNSTIIFIVIGVIILLYLYTTIRGYNNFMSNSPMLISNTVDGSTASRIEGYKLPRPSDGKYGTEYTYSFWVYLKDSNFSSNGSSPSCAVEDESEGGNSNMNFKHIFHKGSNDMYVGVGDGKRNFPLLQSPGVWLYPNSNKLNIRFNTYKNVYETCDIGNIPINKWVHISIILIGSSVDVYVNCNLKKRQKLSNIPKLNDGDLFINNFGGFNGYLSRFRYYNYAIDPFELDLICKMGPASNTPTPDLGSGSPPNYLSPNYWFNYGFPLSAGYPNTTQNVV